METIFDHNPTPEELADICGETTTRENHLSWHNQDSLYSEIYWLYELRGDMATAKNYLVKIKDPQRRFNTQLKDCLGED
jgi:hypothetical protein